MSNLYFFLRNFKATNLFKTRIKYILCYHIVLFLPISKMEDVLNSTRGHFFFIYDHRFRNYCTDMDESFLYE